MQQSVNRIRGLDLFSGIGGISMALSPWVQTIAYCECEPYAQAVLMERMQSGDLDIAPIWDDIRTLNREILDNEIDIIFGGFPCQDISVAGNGKGLAGERSGLFFEIMRLAKEYKPSFIFLENVPAITGRGLDTVATEITSLGYDCRWGVLSAYDVGAPHQRERWFCLAKAVADTGCERRQQESRGSPCDEVTNAGRPTKSNNIVERNGESNRARQISSALADTSCNGLQGLRPLRFEESSLSQRLPRCDSEGTGNFWETVADVRRVVDGLPYRMERIKALGNSVVPQAVQEAFVRLISSTEPVAVVKGDK